MTSLLQLSNSNWIASGSGYSNYPTAFGLQVAMSKDNLQTWTFSDQMNLLSFYNGHLLSGGSDIYLVTASPAFIYKSTDGLNWQLKEPLTCNYVDSAYGNNYIVILCYDNQYKYYTYVNDGVSDDWKKCFYSDLDFYGAHFVYYDNNLKKFIGYLMKENLATSVDGCTWQEEIIDHIGSDLYTYIATDNNALICGENGLTWAR